MELINFRFFLKRINHIPIENLSFAVDGDIGLYFFYEGIFRETRISQLMTSLGKYELHETLGKGGFGTVYRAMDTSLGREVALKVLHPQLMVDDTFLSA